MTSITVQLRGGSDPLANWNGVETPLSEVRISPLDRGFLFGDAIYELVRVYHGRPFLFPDHIDRLKRNLEKLRIPADADALEARARQTLSHSGVQSGTIYFHVTRGEAPRMHRFPDPPPRPNELIVVQSLEDPYAGLRACGAKVLLRPDIRWRRCDIKSTNLLANCLGAEEAHRAGRVETVFYDESGALTEGTRTSLFAVRDGSIVTAPREGNILPGITRKTVLSLAMEIGVPVREEIIRRESLSQMDELFLTGTTTEILPVVQADDVIIGGGRPGPLVQQLTAAYRGAIEEECGGA